MIFWTQYEGWYESVINGITFVVRKPSTDQIDFYATKLAEQFQEKKNEIYNNVIDTVFDFYNRRGYSKEELFKNLGEPQITIFSSKSGLPDGGEICWLKHQLDEHIIIAEFIDDFNIVSIYIDG